ncbi:MAG: sulfite exporter TauE/SafE family protein [Xenococcaceae cyanobacterium]
MELANLLLLVGGGFLSGITAGILGIGGGTILVPLIVTLGYESVKATGTSNLAMVMTAISGSIQNWRMGNLDLTKVLYLGIPSIITSQVGVLLADQVLPDYILKIGFALLLLANIYLISLRKSLIAKAKDQADSTSHDQASTKPQLSPIISRIATGGSAGIIASVFGLGGGVIMVPLQIILLGENIKVAVQTSLGVIVITSIFACTGHALSGNVLFQQGICLGLGGLLGVQLSTRFLPKLPDRTVSWLFRGFMGFLAVYMFVQAWRSYTGA